MPDTVPKRRWFRFSLRTLLIVVTVGAVLSWTYCIGWPWLRDYRKVADLIDQLRESKNKVVCEGIVIPGGEMLKFSAPMIELIHMGPRRLAALHRHIGDKEIQNEVVLILGAIGDKSTVPLLIRAYPEDNVRGLGWADPRLLNVVCFSFALPYLTCQPIGRSREGADCDPGNRKLWEAWWQQNAATFDVSSEKPNMTWVPGYGS